MWSAIPFHGKRLVYIDGQQAVIYRGLYLGLSPPEEPKTPPAVQEVVRVPVDEEGREIEAP